MHSCGPVYINRELRIILDVNSTKLTHVMGTVLSMNSGEISNLLSVTDWARPTYAINHNRWENFAVTHGYGHVSVAEERVNLTNEQGHVLTVYLDSDGNVRFFRKTAAQYDRAFTVEELEDLTSCTIR